MSASDLRWPRAWIVAAITVGCGDLSSADGPQDALFVATGRLEGESLADPVGTYRAQTQWLSFGDGAEIECLLADDPGTCPGMRLETRRVRRPAGFEPTLQGFELALLELPPQDSLLSYGDARLAAASFAIYDDRDDSGAPSPGDVVVASSAFGPMISLIVFREGAVHPFFRWLEAVHGCPPPPSGYSVLRAEQGFGCRVSRITPVVATVRARVPYALAACSGDVVRLIDPPDERPTPRAAGEGVLCLGGNRARIFVDDGALCAPFHATRVEALVGCLAGARLFGCWDDRAVPPDGWICPIEDEDG